MLIEFVLLVVFLLPVFPLFLIRSKTVEGETRLKKVVVCVAARNEEGNIANCLDALVNLNYPKNLVEIRVGDDDSSDRTNEIIKQYVERYDQIVKYEIDQKDTRTKGKARVLAQLTDDLECDYIAFVDADVEVTKDWLKNMLIEIKDDDLISGTTLVRSNLFFGQLQALDWLYGQLQVQLASRVFKKSPTVMGNNMMVKSAAYQKIGGYGKLPFSMTEDVSLQKAFDKEGLRSKLVYSLELLAFTKPEKTWSQLIQQRLRWSNIVSILPLMLKFLLAVQSLFFVVILMLFYLNPLLGLVGLIIRSLLNLVLFKMHRFEVRNYSLVAIIFFETYMWSLGSTVLCSVLLRRKIDWKDRRVS